MSTTYDTVATEISVGNNLHFTNIRRHKRRSTRLVRGVREGDGIIQTSARALPLLSQPSSKQNTTA